MKPRCVITGIGLAVMAAGCSSGKVAGPPSTSAPSATTSTASPAGSVAQQYLSAANGVDAAYAQWKAAVAGKTEVSQITGPATNYAAR